LKISPREMEPRTKEEELTPIDNREGEERESTSNSSQLPRYVGNTRKHTHTKESGADHTLDPVSGTKSFSS
jgi:hypothetical protein